MLILLTACVKPEGNITVLKINSPEVRLQQYKDALRYWIEKTPVTKIVFCDNSNYMFATDEFDELAKIYHKEIEFLRFQGNREKVVACGKGYGEGEIIQHFFEHSKLLVGEDYFLKITGRVTIENFSLLYPLLKEKPGNYFNASKIFDRRKSANTVFFMANVSEYRKHLLSVYHAVQDDLGIVFEKLVRKALLDNNLANHNFPVYPLIDGVAAGPGIPYPKQPERDWYRKYFSKLHFYDLRNW